MTPDFQELISKMTLQEKVALTVGLNPWQTTPIERLGIPSITMSDGPHGVRRAQAMADKSQPATCFPTASALASTWNTALVHELGQALADECIATGVDVLLGPGNNMKRTPLCGRNFEYFSEDPFLGGEMAVAFINGVQSKGVGTSLKHFALNNQETQRMNVSVEVDERPLREIYLAGFEQAVKQARPWTVMCSYNRIHGEHASQHKPLLTGILKNEWGFEGFVVSDWGAVHDRGAALEAGLDLEMPGPQDQRVKKVMSAVEDRRLDEACLDEAVLRLLKIIFKAQETPKGSGGIDVDGHHALARRIAGESIVLLKNEGGLLPLRPEGRLALIGLAAREPQYQGHGSSRVNSLREDVPFDEVQKLAPQAALSYAPGYTLEDQLDQALIDEAVQTASQAEVALLYIALPTFKDSEGADRKDLALSRQQEALIQAVTAAQPRSVVILINGSALDMRPWIASTPAVLEAWLSGQASGGAIADVLFGAVNPSGRLAETFPLKLSDTPAFLNFPGEDLQVRYGEGLYIGYRYYDLKEMEVLFPFGYGLSYTTFELDNLRAAKDTLAEGETLEVLVDVTNTGPVPGQAVVQLYVHDVESALRRPEKELKGFAKLALQPGETRTASIQLDERAWAYYRPNKQGWVVEAGQFDLLAGQSAAGPFLRTTVTVETGPVELPPLTPASTVMDWMTHPQGSQLLMGYVMTMFGEFQAEAGDGMSVTEAVEWAKDLPLETVLAFWGKNLPAAPEDMVKQFLEELRL